MKEIEVPVLIVGGGPVGMMGALLFEQRGVEALVAERYASRLGAPKAHALNSRSLEICNAAGLPMRDVIDFATPTEEGANVRFMTNLSGTEIGSLPYERQDDGVLEFTPWKLVNIQQPDFEVVLERELKGAKKARLQRELEWLGCDAVTDSVVSYLRDHATGEDLRVRSRYLIAADGAGSGVRDASGIKMLGPEALAHYATIHFEADLSAIVKDRPAILYFLFGLGLGSTLIAYDIHKTWVMMQVYDPGTTSFSEFDEATCRGLVRKAVGADVDIDLKGIGPWTMSGQVASAYKSRNVFLAGDAAHRFPPSGGLGLNTGLADIENLAWKIAAVERGEAAEQLLDTYGSERQRIALTNTNQSIANSMQMRKLARALNLEVGEKADLATIEALANDPAKRAELDEAVAAQRDHFDSLRLQLGYIYGENGGLDETLPVSVYKPHCIAGAYLPHQVLSNGGSTLGLVAPVGVTLIAGPKVANAAYLGDDTGINASVQIEGRDFNLASGSWSETMDIPASGAVLVRPDRHILFVWDGTPDGLTRMREVHSGYFSMPEKALAVAGSEKQASIR
ncbi:MAG: FAD-dependent monooxygenase [Parvibaculaceae bacterium]